jgi:bifunctional non-homologous end joining protein LigD
MLATLVDRPFSRPGWLFEPKLDGERCITYKSNSTLELYSRNQNSLNAIYPELLEALKRQPVDSCILDGEVVAFEPGTQRTSFHRLQGRMQARSASPLLQANIPVFYYLFDLLSLHGNDLRGLTLQERKRILQKTLRWKDPLRFSTHRETEGERFYKKACQLGWEGLIAKRMDSRYSGGRSRDWLKLKCVLEQEFVIGGFTDPQGTRNAFGSLLIGYYNTQGLQFAGKVGTGFDESDLSTLQTKLQRLERRTSPFTRVDLPRRGLHWVEPRLVAQIGFGEWTPDGKLRHPRYLGLRDDKPARDVAREFKRVVPGSRVA